jgi:hypothetical protein
MGVVLLLLMTIVAVAVFMLITVDNRSQKGKNSAPYVTPEGQKKSKTPGLD